MAVVPVTVRSWQRLAMPLGMAIPLGIIVVAVLAIPLAAAQALALTSQQTGAWLFGLYGIPGLLSLVLTRIYRQPLFLGWHTAVVAFLASLAGQVPYADLLGAMVVGMRSGQHMRRPPTWRIIQRELPQGGHAEL